MFFSATKGQARPSPQAAVFRVATVSLRHTTTAAAIMAAVHVMSTDPTSQNGGRAP